MSLGDISVVGGSAMTPVLTFRTDDRDTSGASATIKPGEPVKQNNSNFVLLLATGDPEQGTDAFVGIAHNTSDETASAEGTVNVEVIVPFVTKLRAKATTVANINTDAKLKLLENDAVTFDLTGSTFTIDEDEGDDPNVHGLVIVGGDISKGTLDVYVKPLATLFGNAIA